MSDESRGVDNSYRVSDEERSIYRSLGYFFLGFVVYSLARHFIPQPFGTGIGVFLFAFGSWFADPGKRSKISLLPWMGICVVGSVVVAAAVRWIERL